MTLGALIADLSSTHQKGVVDAGREPELFGLVAFLLTFAVVRGITQRVAETPSVQRCGADAEGPEAPPATSAPPPWGSAGRPVSTRKRPLA